MLIHIVPNLKTTLATRFPFRIQGLECPELGVELNGETDLVTRRPYSDKSFLVACRTVGHQITEGIFLKTTSRIHTFTVITRWKTAGHRLMIVRSHYLILDSIHEAVTEHRKFSMPTQRKSRTSLVEKWWAAEHTPCAVVGPWIRRQAITAVQDIFIEMSTIEPERLLNGSVGGYKGNKFMSPPTAELVVGCRPRYMVHTWHDLGGKRSTSPRVLMLPPQDRRRGVRTVIA